MPKTMAGANPKRQVIIAQFAIDFGRQAVPPGQGLFDGLVQIVGQSELLSRFRHAQGQDATQTQVAEGTGHRPVHLHPRQGILVVKDRGCAAVERLKSTQHRGQIGVALGHEGDARPRNRPHPFVQRQTLAQPLLEGLKQVGVGVDQAGEDKMACSIQASAALCTAQQGLWRAPRPGCDRPGWLWLHR